MITILIIVMAVVIIIISSDRPDRMTFIYALVDVDSDDVLFLQKMLELSKADWRIFASVSWTIISWDDNGFVAC